VVLTAALLGAAVVYAVLTAIAPNRITDPDAAATALRDPAPVVTATPTAPPAEPSAPRPTLGVQPATPPPAPDRRAPTRIAVPSIGAELPVVPTGVRDDGAMEIPDDPRTAGWYRFGPGPTTDSGAMVVSAHIDSRELVGPLARLGEVSPGDEVIVAAADEEVRYVIERVDSYPKQVIDLDAVFDRGGAARLHLVTCGGRWDPDTGHYEDNVVAVAVRADIA